MFVQTATQAYVVTLYAMIPLIILLVLIRAVIWLLSFDWVQTYGLELGRYLLILLFGFFVISPEDMLPDRLYAMPACYLDDLVFIIAAAKMIAAKPKNRSFTS